MTLSLNTTFAQPARNPKPVSFIGRLRISMALARQRRQLVALDAHLLADIGVSREQAEKEAAKSTWDVPQHWRQ